MSLDTWLNVAAALLLAVLAFVWARKRPAYLLAIFGIVAAAITVATLPLDEWLVQRLTILHEGNSARTLEALFSHEHIGAGMANLWRDLSAGQALPITTLLRLNLAATVLFTGGLLLAVTELLRPKWSVIPFLALLVATSPFVVIPAVSELPSPLLNLYFVAALLPAALIARGETSGVIRHAAVALLVMLGVLSVRTRIEMLILVVPAGAVLLIQLLGAGSVTDRVDRIERGVIEACKWLLARPVGLILATTLCLTAEIAVQTAVGGHASWVAAALNPLDLLVFRLPVVIAEATSLGVAALFCLGWFHALKRWRAYAGLSLALLVIARLYLSSSHRVDEETFRYLTHLGAALLFLSALGVRQLQLIFESRAESGGTAPPRAAMAALLLLCIPVGGNVLEQLQLLTPDADAEQREARFVARQLLGRPECAFVAPVVQRSGPPAVLILRAGHAPVSVDDLDAALGLNAMPSCTLLYAGLDCHLVGRLECAELAGEVVESEHFVAGRYSHSPEYGFMQSDITLRVRQLR